jgi:beta-glucosidase
MAAMPKAAVAILASLLVASAAAPLQPPLYRDASQPIAARVDDLLGRMTLEEKFWQLFMIPGDLDDPAHDYSKGSSGCRSTGGAGHRASEAARAARRRSTPFSATSPSRHALGIPIIPFEEALHGLTREGALCSRRPSRWRPRGTPRSWNVCTSAIAARRAAAASAWCSRRCQHRDDVRWGRVEETYGEDRISRGDGPRHMRAFESAGIVTTPKHFVANVGEGGRDSYPIDHSDRASRSGTSRRSVR